jgi:hypothetical protein
MGLFDRFLKPKKPALAPTSAEVVQSLLMAYGAAIEAHAATGGTVADVSKLPAPKEVLRKVLFALITATEDRVAREQLRGSYVMLAEFQPEVGPEIIKLDLQLRPGESVQSQAARVAAQAPLVMKWGQRVTDEMAVLLKQLTDAKL